MARRTDHSRDELAELVAGAAEKLARREGLRGVAMRRIAAEIGYAAGSIYNAVGDLDAVVLRVNARTLERLRAALVRVVDPARPPIENALAVADGYHDFVARQPRRWGVILEHVLPPGTDVPDWYEEVPLSVLISDSRTWNEPVDPPPLALDQTAWDTLRLPVMRVADREDLRKLAHWYGTVNGGSLASIDYRSAKELRRTLDETIESAERTIGSDPHTMWRTGSGGY